MIALLAAPFAAYAKLRGTENHANYARMVAAAVGDEWKKASNQPLRLMAGPFGLVVAAAAYAPDRPLNVRGFLRLSLALGR